MDDKLLEPLNAYKQYYAENLTKNAEARFSELLTQSGIDADANRATVKRYDDEQSLVDRFARKLSTLKGWRVFLIILAVVGGILFLAGIFALIGGSFLAGGILLALGAALLISMIVVVVKVINPVLKNSEAERQVHLKKAQELLREAWTQMAPLNALFDSNITKQLIEKTVPLLKIDDNFNMKRYDYLSGKYGFGDPNNAERSTIGILTGEILGNPFVIDRELVHSMGSHSYHGSLVISWTTHYTDSKGNHHTQTHTQTLHASVTRPKPYYTEETRLIYGNEAASELHFTHTPSHAERLSEKQLASKVNSGSKKIKKKQEKSISSGGSGFTEMGNSEFDVLFGALDRDNEVQFRLLFTPLAQKNMLALMKDNCGWGDDFSMVKAGPLNFISSEHSASWDMDVEYSRYLSYSVDLSHKEFVRFNQQYFKSLYFDFAPLLSIPLYQQQKPREYIYRENYPRNYTVRETEYLVNAMNSRAFAPEHAATPSILKTSLLGTSGKSDKVHVTAQAYRTVDRVDFVPVLGGDGRIHNVPVPWVEFIPIARERVVTIKELGLSDREFEQKSAAGLLKETLEKYAFDAFSYKHGILCCISGNNESGFDSDFAKCIE